MPKLIDYPRTSYTGAWEVAEVVDDTGGKCALETCARKLNRKVSGSFKAIIGSAVKFGLLTSKREMLSTTTLFRRIKHAYDKQEELVFHREAFLTPPLFTQLCRKFRSRELPVAMLDVMLIREFGVEEINAQGVAKAFVDGARMVGLLDERNVVADIDQLAAQQPPRRELASSPPAPNAFRTDPPPAAPDEEQARESRTAPRPASPPRAERSPATAHQRYLPTEPDAVTTLFGLSPASDPPQIAPRPQPTSPLTASSGVPAPSAAEQPGALRPPVQPAAPPRPAATAPKPDGGRPATYQIRIGGPGINTELEVQDAADLALVRALLDKIERQLG